MAEWTGGIESNFLLDDETRVWGFFVPAAEVNGDGSVTFGPWTQEMLDAVEWDSFTWADGGLEMAFTFSTWDGPHTSVAAAMAAGEGCADIPVQTIAPCVLVCPADAAVDETIHAYFLDEEGAVITRQEHLDAGYTWCFFFVMDTIAVYPDNINGNDGDIETTMTPEGGVPLTMTQNMKELITGI